MTFSLSETKKLTEMDLLKVTDNKKGFHRLYKRQRAFTIFFY